MVTISSFSPVCTNNFNLHVFFVDKNKKRLKLNVGVTLESIMNMDELASLMTLQLQIQVSWVDSRLTFLNVHKNRLNPLSLAQKNRLWLPSLIFYNTNDKTVASFNDDSSKGKIELNPLEKGQRAPLTEVKNYIKYTGSQG